MSTDTYTTADEARAAIADAINAGDADAADYDLDSILDDCYTWDADRQAFTKTADADEFWASVEAHRATTKTITDPATGLADELPVTGEEQLHRLRCVWDDRHYPAEDQYLSVITVITADGPWPAVARWTGETNRNDDYTLATDEDDLGTLADGGWEVLA